MKKDDFIYVEHIYDNMCKAQDYVKGITLEQFLQDEEKQDAVIRKIEVLGEATKRVSNDLRSKYPTVPWKAMAGMRDKLIHDYMEVNIKVVWATVTSEIKVVQPMIEKILEDNLLG